MPDSTTQHKRPSGRRSGESGTRDAILDAARDLFAERGYDGASIRAIAAAAGVDPALIRHFFSDKQALFTATVADRTAIPQRLGASLAGDPATAGARVADTYLTLWEEPETRRMLLSLVRSAVTSEVAAQMLQATIGGQVLPRSNGDGMARTRRIALAGSHLFGVAIARYVLKLPAMSELGHDELVDLISPAIQHYLTGEDEPTTRED